MTAVRGVGRVWSTILNEIWPAKVAERAALAVSAFGSDLLADVEEQVDHLDQFYLFDAGAPDRCWKCGGPDAHKVVGEGGFAWCCVMCPHPSDDFSFSPIASAPCPPGVADGLEPISSPQVPVGSGPLTLPAASGSRRGMTPRGGERFPRPAPSPGHSDSWESDAGALCVGCGAAFDASGLTDHVDALAAVFAALHAGCST
jgi:hypothetical protein